MAVGLSPTYRHAGRQDRSEPAYERDAGGDGAAFQVVVRGFEPVRVNMEGRWRRGESLPGLPAEHYDLFPDRLVDSERGGAGGVGA